MRARLAVAGTIGGLAAVVVLVVLVLKFGQHHPSPPSLADHPNAAIPGQLLYADDHDCLVRVAASGAEREQVYCPGGPVLEVTWVDGHTAAFAGAAKPGQPTWTQIDLSTKIPTETGRAATFPPPDEVSVKGERVNIASNGDIYVFANGTRTKIASFDVPEYGEPMLVTWSPDGGWLLLLYQPRKGNHAELWIVSRDGSIKGTVADDVRAWGGPFASWWIDGAGFLPKHY